MRDEKRTPLRWTKRVYLHLFTFHLIHLTVTRTASGQIRQRELPRIVVGICRALKESGIIRVIRGPPSTMWSMYEWNRSMPLHPM